MPVGRQRRGVGHLGPQVGVADVAVAVADEVVHQRGHRLGGPGKALVQAGRAGLARQAGLQAERGRRHMAQQRAGIPVAVAARPLQRVEGRGLIAPQCAQAVVVALHRAGVAEDTVGAQADLADPAAAVAPFPFGKGTAAQAAAEVDVPEGVRAHHATHRRPPVVEHVGVAFQAQAQQAARVEIHLGLQRCATGGRFGQHGHAETIVVAVGAHVHRMVHRLLEGARLQRAPAEAPGVAQVQLAAAVVGHVHALVREALEADALLTELELQQVVAMPHGDADIAVAGVVGRRGDHLGRDRHAALGAWRCRLEAARRTQVGLAVGGGAGVQAQPGVGPGGRQVAAAAMAVAAGKAAQRGLDQRLVVGGERRRCRIHLDGAADAVASGADRRRAGIHLDAAHVAGVDVRQRRVHVVGAGGHQVHAVDLGAQPVVGQPAQHRQAGHTAGAIEAEPRDVLQQPGGVSRAAPRARQRPLAQLLGKGVGLGGRRAAGHHHLLGWLGACLLGGRRPRQQRGQGGEQAARAVPHQPWRRRSFRPIRPMPASSMA